MERYGETGRNGERQGETRKDKDRERYGEAWIYREIHREKGRDMKRKGET